MKTTQRNAYIALTGGQADKISEEKVGVTRKVIIITNLNASGGANIYIAIGEEAAANKGIQLLPGQSITLSRDAGYTPPQSTIFAYAAAGGSSVAIYEEVELK